MFIMSERGLLFKYKSLNSIEDFDRLMQILVEHKIWLVKPSKLNDPFEGKVLTDPNGKPIPKLVSNLFSTGGVLYGYDLRCNNSLEKIDEYGVLSLSEVCMSPQLWAHYSNEGTGVCIGFWNNGVFKTAEKITYTNINGEENPEITVVGDKSLLTDKNIAKSLLVKEHGWKYEHEVRYISHIGICKDSEEEKGKRFLKLDKKDIACIIFGYKTPESIIYVIKSYLITMGVNIPFFVASVKHGINNICLYPLYSINTGNMLKADIYGRDPTLPIEESANLIKYWLEDVGYKTREMGIRSNINSTYNIANKEDFKNIVLNHFVLLNSHGNTESNALKEFHFAICNDDITDITVLKNLLVKKIINDKTLGNAETLQNILGYQVKMKSVVTKNKITLEIVVENTNGKMLLLLEQENGTLTEYLFDIDDSNICNKYKHILNNTYISNKNNKLSIKIRLGQGCIKLTCKKLGIQKYTLRFTEEVYKSIEKGEDINGKTSNRSE